MQIEANEMTTYTYFQSNPDLADRPPGAYAEFASDLLSSWPSLRFFFRVGRAAFGLARKRLRQGRV